MSTQGKRLKEIRQHLKLTQGELGEHLNMSKQYFSKAETDKIVLNNKQLSVLCSEYQVNINYLLTGNGNMFNTASAIVKNADNFTKQVIVLLKENGLI